MKKIIIISSIILAGLISGWYFDICHKPVETIDELIGKNYGFALKLYYKTEPNEQYRININNKLNEFDGGLYDKKAKLKDSIIYVYTWTYMNHKQRIWVGETEALKSEIIDAIRYKNSVQF